jgi:molecular chaperone GrpE (heat shock protein)
MSRPSQPTVPKWPFFFSDAFMLGLAWLIYAQGKFPLDAFNTAALCACVAVGAAFAVTPFVLDYRLTLKATEAEALTTTMAQVQNLETVATQIAQATSQWQTVQDHCAKTTTAAREIGERMATEGRAFAEFMQKANDAEKANLRLEVEKLRRVEADWLQVLVRMLDHTFALHKAALRSGKPALIEQISQFQGALRDAARRVGVSPFSSDAGEPFDQTKHQANQPGQPTAEAVVRETLATGYTFRGQMVRPALVELTSPAEAVVEPAASTAPADDTPKEPTLF